MTIIKVLLFILMLFLIFLAGGFCYFKVSHTRLKILIPRFIKSLSNQEKSEIILSHNYKKMINSLKIFSFYVNSQIVRTQKDYNEVNNFMIYKVIKDKGNCKVAQIHLRSYPLESIKTKFSVKTCAVCFVDIAKHILDNNIADKVQLITHNHLISERIYEKYIHNKFVNQGYKLSYIDDYDMEYMIWIYCELFLINKEIDFFSYAGLEILSKVNRIIYVGIE